MNLYMGRRIDRMNPSQDTDCFVNYNVQSFDSKVLMLHRKF